MRLTLFGTALLAAALLAGCEPGMEEAPELASLEGEARIDACPNGECGLIGAACPHTGDCGDGLACQAASGTCKRAGTTGTACEAKGDCTAGHTCDLMFGICRLDVAAPAWPRIGHMAINDEFGPCSESLDLTGDGVIDMISTFSYGPTGDVIEAKEMMGSCALTDAKLIVAKENLTCTPPDGTVTGRTVWDRDGLGRVRTIDKDIDGDGAFDSRSTYVYDANGTLHEARHDLGLDGTVDAITKWTWSAGQLTSTQLDTNGDGKAERIISYIWSANGYLLAEIDDTDADGLLDATNVYEYDAGGLPTVREWDGYGPWTLTNAMCGTGVYAKGADGQLDKRLRWSWGSDGLFQGEKTIWFLVNKGFSGSFVIRDDADRVSEVVRQSLEAVDFVGRCKNPLMGITQRTWSYDWSCK